MNFDYSEADEYEAEFAALGAVEFDELEDEDCPTEVAMLAEKVRAARSWA
jgi:hypothetical protein